MRYSKDPQEDVQRRDFTINGLLMDPLDGDRVLDFVGGRDDLKAGIVRAIGDAECRFQEDKLRMLRAVRFAARFQYAIEPETFAAIQKLAPLIHQVSTERVRDELTKMLTEGHARAAFELLDATGLLQQVLPEIERMKGVEQPPQFHPEGDVWIHTLLLLEKLKPRCSRTLAWGALLHDVGKPPTFRVAPDRIRFDGHVEVGVKMAEEICRRLHFSNEETKQILALVANHMRFGDVEKMKESTLKRFMRLPQVRGAHGTASARLPEQPPQAGDVRVRSRPAGAYPGRGDSAASTAEWERFDRAGISARTALSRGVVGGGGRAARRHAAQQGRSAVVRAE